MRMNKGQEIVFDDVSLKGLWLFLSLYQIFHIKIVKTCIKKYLLMVNFSFFDQFKHINHAYLDIYLSLTSPLYSS